MQLISFKLNYYSSWIAKTVQNQYLHGDLLFSSNLIGYFQYCINYAHNLINTTLPLD